MDLRVQKVLNWETSVVIFDSYLSDRSTDIIRAVSTRTTEKISSQFQPMSIFLHNVNSSGTEKVKDENHYENILRLYKSNKFNKFLIFSSSIKEVLKTAAKLNLLNTFNQWLFFIPPAKEISDISSLTEGVVEGSNIAFVFNSTAQGSCNVSTGFPIILLFIENTIEVGKSISKSVRFVFTLIPSFLSMLDFLLVQKNAINSAGFRLVENKFYCFNQKGMKLNVFFSNVNFSIRGSVASYPSSL